MKKIVLCFSILCIIGGQSLAQDYMSFMQQGKLFFSNQNYISAFENFDQALENAKSDIEIKDAKLWKTNCLKSIKKIQKENELKIKSNANELKYSKSLLDAIYFYDNKIALAYNDGKYGFINKNGNTQIAYKYDQAGCFDAITGFAKVSLNKKNYLVDTVGREYPLAETLNALSGEIEALDLSKSHLTELPKEIFNYPALKILIISNNNITVLPNEIGRLKELKYFDATGNNILSVPKEIGTLTNLKFISFRNNGISKLPNEIANLQQLEKIDLSNNQLFDLPLGLASLYDLKVLLLDGNKIAKLSPDIGLLLNLKYLSIQSNILTTIPVEFGRLSRLQSLCLSDNKITDLPGETGRLISLITFNISRNQLTYVPTEIKQLNQLKHFDIRGNSLSNDKKDLIKSWLPNCDLEL
jgi:hypothetical protein